MPSSENGLDRRRLKDVRARELGGENYSLDSYKARIRHLRLVELVGEAEATAHEHRLYLWRKAWATQ